MPEQLPVWRVEVSFAGTAPGQQVARAPGVSGVVVTGPVLRCLVCGSFQPFLEALRGYEVVGFGSAPAFAGAAPPAPDIAAGPGPGPDDA